jgi:hypothetical protein
MAVRGVNIVVCGAAHGDTGTVAFIADDERGARAAPEDADIEYEMDAARLNRVKFAHQTPESLAETTDGEVGHER